MKHFSFGKLTVIVACVAMMTGCAGQPSQEGMNRKPGNYPGNPEEWFAPKLVTDNTYRNVAKLRAAYASSSFDYNLTAQLATDGIVSETMPPTTQLFTQDGEVPRIQKEIIFDSNDITSYIVNGNDIFLQLDMADMQLDIDQIALRGRVVLDTRKTRGYEVKILASVDGTQWDELDAQSGSNYFGVEGGAWAGYPPRKVATGESPVRFLYEHGAVKNPPVVAPATNAGPNPMMTRTINYVVKLPAAKTYNHFKIEMKMPSAQSWTITSWDFAKGDEPVSALPSFRFNSAWMSASAGNEWLMVDLGTKAQFDKVNLHWINKAVKGVIEASDDAKTWKQVAELPGGEDLNDVIALNKTVKSRYVRLNLTEAAGGKPYVLSEMEVMGKGGLVAQNEVAEATWTNLQVDNGQILNGQLSLDGGNWKLQRASEVNASGEAIAQSGFNDEAWIAATVPGTVLSSYVNIGAVADPNVADNQFQVSESFFYSDFWYRHTFNVDALGERMFLDFNGINWKAEFFLNGKQIGNIDGAFIRGKFDVTDVVKQGENVLAVKIIKNAHPGVVKEQTAWSPDYNGGVLGADNPTFHASIGWDWIPTIRGRNIGIWNDVYLTYAGAVTIEDPFVQTDLPLPDTDCADILAEATLKNHSDKAVKGVLNFNMEKDGAGVTEQMEVELAPGESKLVKLPSARLDNPKLWWPVDYGEQNLYDSKFTFTIDNRESDVKTFKTGVRELTFIDEPYVQAGGILRGKEQFKNPVRLTVYINGKRAVGFGGNWGMPESNLNYRGREYDAAVKYHADMHFTIIRDWVGMIGDEEFYEACDKYGVLIWQDFWLANPADGPDPYYEDMFVANARDYVKRIRNHAALGVYVGRNEGNPPASLDGQLRDLVAELHPGMRYISHSADGVVSGEGPYNALEPIEYFRNYGHDRFHSERGMPNVMTYESMKLAFGEENLEPVSTLATPNAIYGLHDYALGGSSGPSAQQTETFNKMIAKMFDKPKNAEEFAEWAQWVNYNGYRAMFEGRGEHRRGLLLWMSHPAWPSMVWQTYDYYLNPTGGYFGSKKACEPIHIQWNPVRDDIEVVNYYAGDFAGVTGTAQLISQDGQVVWEKQASFDVKNDETVALFLLEEPDALSNTYFIKLTLKQGDNLLSENFYVRGKEDGNYQSLLELPYIELGNDIKIVREGDEWVLDGTLKNDSDTPALMIRLAVKGDKTACMMAPVVYNENYFSLMPGESKQIHITLANADTQGEKPTLEVTGFNVTSDKAKIGKSRKSLR